MGIQTGVKPRNLVTQNAAFEHHYLAAVAAISIADVSSSCLLGKLWPMPALPPKADIAEGDWYVRLVPKADI